MSPIVKKKGERFTLPSKYVLLILTAVCVSLMVITFNTDFSGGPLRDVVGVVIVPFENGVSAAGGYLKTRSEQLAQIRDLLAENEALQSQIDELTIENTTLQQERYELTYLRDLYALDSEYEDYEKIGARIIAKDSGNWFSSFVINKGTNDGLAVDMNVLAAGGLVGRIEEIGPNWARVLGIISDNSNVSAMVLSSSDHMIVSGNLSTYAKGVIDFSQLVDSDDVVEGDKIVTSNISDKYLPGILIGYISTISNDSNNLTKSGFITPAVDFEHLEEVLVITRQKNIPAEATGQVEEETASEE
ncbi:MAG: rod shape-determining protein MreC [Lachnospiraceae bacterium]|nr:rod shape-determining protein MreC [Lachnospiraceae bacterium]